MKNLLFSTAFILTILNLTAQKKEIIEFQKKHPEIALISQERFNSLSHEDIAILGENYIVFNQNIESIDISSFSDKIPSTKSSIDISNQTEMSKEQLNFVKIWITSHSYVKIVKQSEYIALSEEDKLVYLNNHCMVLIGENITLTDITLYPY